METFLDGKVTLIGGDCLEVMTDQPADSVDAILTDPPYHLASTVKRFGKPGSAEAKSDGATGVYKRASAGFMGKQWDGGDIAFQPETWMLAMKALKPGGHLVAFGAPKNVHRLTCAIEDAGFEIRDVVMWLFGTGFPKSHNRDIGGVKWGTGLKPAYEPIIIARKPLIGTVAANIEAHGTGALNIDGCRVPADESTKRPIGPPLNGGAYCDPSRSERESLGTIGGSDNGRWPANIAHDGSAEVVELFPQTGGGGSISNRSSPKTAGIYGVMSGEGERWAGYADNGSAARFFYCAKANADERIGSKHPTVKPLDLLQWLIRMVTPKGGIILDPFAGTGTMAEAALREGMRATLIEREPEYQEDIRARMAMVMMGPEERERALLKRRGEVEPFETTELGAAA